MREEVYIEAKMDLNQVYNELNKLENTIKSKDVNLKIKATVDREGLNAARELDTSINKLSTSIDKLKITNTGGAQSTLKFKESLDSVTDGVRKTTDAYGSLLDKKVELINRIQELKTGLKSAGEGLRDSLLKELHLAQLELKNTNAEMRAFEKQAITSVGGAQTIFDKFTKSLQIGFFSTFGAFSLAGMVKKGFDSFGKYIKSAMTEAIEFESAFAGVRKTIDASESEFQRFNRQLKQMTTEIPRTYQELAKIAELGGQMGVPLEELGAFTKAIAALEVSTDIGLEDAALQFSRLATIMNISMEDISRIGSAVVGLGNNFAATESEITSFMTRIAGTANVVNMTAGDVSGIAAAFTSVGIAAEKGGTAINKMLLAIETAVVSGGKDLETFAKLTGKTAEEFSKGWRENAGSIFADIVEGLGEAGAGANDYLVELLGNGTRIKEVFLNMAGASDQLRNAIEMGNTAYAQNVALWEEAAKRYGTVESQLQILDNRMAISKERLGKDLVPALMAWKGVMIELNEWLGKVISGIVEFIQKVDKGAVGAVSGVGAILGVIAGFAVNPALGIIIAGISGVTYAFKNFSDMAKEIAEDMNTVEAAMKDINLQVDDVEKKIGELYDAYQDGKIGIEEYTNELTRLIKTQEDLKEKQDAATRDWAVYNNLVETADKAQRDFMASQEDLIKKELDLESKKKELADLTKKIEETEAAIIKLGEADPDLSLRLGEMEEQHKTLSNSINQLSSELDEGRVKNEQYAKSALKYKILESAAGQVDGLAEAIQILNNNPMKTDEDIKAAKAQQKAVRDLINEYIKLQEVKLAEASENLRAQRNMLMADTDVWFMPIKKQTKELEKATKEFDSLSRSIAEMKEALNKDDFFDDIDVSLIDKTSEANELFEKGGLTIAQYREQIAKLNDGIENSVVGSKEYNDALEVKSKLQKKLNEIIADQQELLKEEVKGAKSAEDAKKAQIKLIELEAMRRIESLKLIAENEEQLAEGIVGIAEWASKEKKKLEEDYLSLAVDGAKEIIKKYEEIRKVGVQAFKDITKEIESNAKEIDKLTDNIDKIKKKLSELDDTKVKDLGARYVEVKEQIEAITKKIEEAELQTEEFSDSSLTVKEGWDELQKSIKEVTKSTEDYAKQIEEIREKMEDLNKTEVDKLSERYAKVVEEIKTISKDLEPLQKYDILTDSDAQKKLELEDKLNKLLSEQLKIRGALSPEQLLRADEMVGETETDKIIREAQEKRDTYQQELKDFELKLQTENNLLADYKKREDELLKKYAWLEVDTDKKKYDDLVKNIKEYTTERDKLLKEQSHLEMLLSAKDIQDAINQSKKTETQLILDKYNLELATMNAELDEYKKLQKNKIEALTQFYLDALELQKKYKALGLDFTPEQKQQLATAAQQVASIPKEQQYISQDYLITQNKLLKEQEEAKDKLDIIAKSLAKISDAQLKGMGDQALREMFAKIAELKIVASGANIGSSSSTTNSIVNNQSFNLASNLDAQAIARQIRLAIKL